MTIVQLRQKQKAIKESILELQLEWGKFLLQLSTPHLFIVDDRALKLEIDSQGMVIHHIEDVDYGHVLTVDGIAFILSKAHVIDVYELKGE